MNVCMHICMYVSTYLQPTYLLIYLPIYHIYFTHSSNNRHLGCFQVLTNIINNVIITMGVQIVFHVNVFISFRLISREELLGHGSSTFIFWATLIVFLIMTVPIYSSTNSVQGFHFLHTLIFLMTGIQAGTRNTSLQEGSYLLVLIWFSLMTGDADVEHCFHLCIFLEQISIVILCPVFNRTIFCCQVLWVLYILLDINPYQTYELKYHFRFISLSFHFGFICCVKAFQFAVVPLVCSFVVVLLFFGEKFKKSPPRLMSRSISCYSGSKSFMVSGLTCL